MHDIRTIVKINRKGKTFTLPPLAPADAARAAAFDARLAAERKQ